MSNSGLNSNFLPKKEVKIEPNQLTNCLTQEKNHLTQKIGVTQNPELILVWTHWKIGQKESDNNLKGLEKLGIVTKMKKTGLPDKPVAVY